MVPPLVPDYCVLKALPLRRKAQAELLLGRPNSDGEPSTTWSATGEYVLIKAVSLESASQRAAADTEVAALLLASASRGRVSVPAHIIPLLDVWHDAHARRLYLVMPYCSGGDLYGRVERTFGGLTPTEARLLFGQMIRGLLELRDMGLTHGDVSLENVVLAEKGTRAYLADLGSVCTTAVPVPSRGYRGKLEYAAPEIFLDKHVDALAVDMWACGVCLYTMLTGCPLYEGPDDSAFELLAMGKTADLIRYYATYGAFLEPAAQALVCRMLQPRPADRPSLEEVLRDPWMCQGLGGVGVGFQSSV